MNKRLTLKTIASTVICGILAGPAVLAYANDAANFPNKPIRIVVGFPPGGSTDGPTRVLADNVSKMLGVAVVVENKTGAGGTMPAYTLQSSAPDGYTLGIISAGVFRLPYTTKISWDPLKDIDYVIGLTGYAFGLVVNASSSITNWTEYVAYAKAHPGELTYATPGIASTNHLTMERISRKAGLKLNHVPYKGSAESIRAVLSGEVQSAAETSAWAPQVEAGKFRLLVVWSDKRMARFPNVPTLKESGIDIVQASPWGIGVPKGTSPAVIKKLHDTFKQAMEMPNFKRSLAQFDMEPIYMDPVQYRRFAAESMEREKDILKSLNIVRQ
jgi:tripartite-type tricarboxylate transporter receptor subunit TctC